MNIKSILKELGKFALMFFLFNLFVNIISRYTGGGDSASSGFVQKLFWLPDTFIPLPGANNPDGSKPAA